MQVFSDVLVAFCTEKRLNTSLKDLSLALTNHGRDGLFSFLSSLPISVLRNLELEANKLYDRANKLYKAAILTRCYVQHFLSPYIDSEVNHKRHFIKIPFINKGIELGHPNYRQEPTRADKNRKEAFYILIH